MDNLFKIIKLQIQVIGICEQKIKEGACLNGSIPMYTFEFEPATYTHGGVVFFINENSCYKVRNDLKIFLKGGLKTVFIDISFDKKKKIVIGFIVGHVPLMIFVIIF